MKVIHHVYGYTKKDGEEIPLRLFEKHEDARTWVFLCKVINVVLEDTGNIPSNLKHKVYLHELGMETYEIYQKILY